MSGIDADRLGCFGISRRGMLSVRYQCRNERLPACAFLTGHELAQYRIVAVLIDNRHVFGICAFRARLVIGVMLAVAVLG